MLLQTHHLMMFTTAFPKHRVTLIFWPYLQTSVKIPFPRTYLEEFVVLACTLPKSIMRHLWKKYMIFLSLKLCRMRCDGENF